MAWPAHEHIRTPFSAAFCPRWSLPDALARSLRSPLHTFCLSLVPWNRSVSLLLFSPLISSLHRHHIPACFRSFDNFFLLLVCSSDCSLSAHDHHHPHHRTVLAASAEKQLQRSLAQSSLPQFIILGALFHHRHPTYAHQSPTTGPALSLILAFASIRPARRRLAAIPRADSHHLVFRRSVRLPTSISSRPCRQDRAS